MMENNGSCVNNAPDGYILHVLILIQNKIPMLCFNALNAKKLMLSHTGDATYQELATQSYKKKKNNDFLSSIGFDW